MEKIAAESLLLLGSKEYQKKYFWSLGLKNYIPLILYEIRNQRNIKDIDYAFYHDFTKILEKRVEEEIKSTSIQKLNRFQIYFDYFDKDKDILYFSFNLNFILQNHLEEKINLFCEIHNFISLYLLKDLKEKFGTIVLDTNKDEINDWQSQFPNY